MYQIIDDKEEQKKYNEVVNKITPQSLGLKPTTDFAQFAQQTIFDENPEKAKVWIDKGAIGVMEAGRRFAEDFNGTYDNVKEYEYSKWQKAGQGLIKSIGNIVENTIGKVYDFKKTTDEQMKNPVQSPLQGHIEKNDNKSVIYDKDKLNKQIGFLEGLGNGVISGEAVPLFGNTIKGAYEKRIRSIADKIKNGEEITQAELNSFNFYKEKEYEKMIRGYSVGGQIGEAVLPSLLAFGGEMMLGGAALKALGWLGKGKALGALTGANLLKTGKVNKGIAKGIAFTTGTVAEAGMSAGVATVVNLPTNLFATYQERRLNDEMKITDRGTAIFQEALESPAKAFFKSLGQVYIAYFTEGLGGLIGEPLKQGSKVIKGIGAEQFAKVLKANPAIEKIVKKTAPILARTYEKMNKLPLKGKSVDWLKSQVKFDGFIEELGEEVLEDVLNLAIGTNNEERSLENYVNKIVKTPVEWAVLCGVIALQGAAISVAGNTLGDVMYKNGASFEDIVQVSNNSTEAEKIELIDEAIKRGDLNIPENALMDNVEIQKEEVEQKVYNQLLKGRVSEDVAIANSKLVGQFFTKWNEKGRDVFQKLVSKLEVQYNIPKEVTETELKKQLLQQSIYFQSNKNVELNEQENNDIQNYKNFIQKVFDNKLSNKEKSKPYIIGNTPKALIESGISENKLAIGHKVINKAYSNKNSDHNLSKETISNAIEALHNPIAIVKDEIKSNEKINNRYGVIVDLQTNNGDFVMISIEADKDLGRDNIINDIRTIHSRKSFVPMIEKALDNNRLIKIKKNKLKDLLYGGINSTDSISEGSQVSLINKIEQKNKEIKILFQSIIAGINPKQKVDIVDLTSDFSNAQNLSKEELSTHIKNLIGSKGINSKDKKALFEFVTRSKRIGKRDVLIPGHIANSSKVEKTFKGERNTAVRNITDLLKNSILIEKTENKDKKTKPNVDSYLRFYVPIRVNNNIFTVRIVAENNNEKNLFNILNADVYDVIVDKKMMTRSTSPENQGNLGESSNYSINDNINNFNPETITIEEMLKGVKDTEGKTYYQETGEWVNTEEEKLIAGYTYPEVLEKLTEIYKKLGNEKLSQVEQDKLMTKANILEDAFEVAENSAKFSNEERNHEIMLNAYYIMNNQEVPDKYVDTDKTTQRTYRDYLEIHKRKKEEKEREYLGYFNKVNDKSFITIMSNHNSSTALHELGHFFLEALGEVAKVDENARVQLETVNKWLGSEGVYTVAQQEKFARSFEAYLYKGKAPNNNLRTVFENFKEWLKSVYSHITELVDRGADISSEVTEMFDKMFANDEYYQERKLADELLKKVKNISRKEKMSKISSSKDLQLDEVQKRHKNVAYAILSVGTGKDIKYLKRIFETDSTKNGYGRRREVVEEMLDRVDDKITVSGGLRREWAEFFTDTGVSYDNDEIDGDYKLVEQALDVIINKAYRNPEKMVETEAEERAEYYAKVVDEADRQYKALIRSFEKENRNVALSAIYEWLNGLDSQIKQDYEDKFIYDSAMIERRENEDKFEKAKRQILSKALELENRHSISDNEKYKEVVKEVMKNLNFLQPTDKAKLTANVLDVPSVDFLMSSIDNILDIAKTMEDVDYRRNLEREIHKELQKTKNIKKNGRTVGKYDYKSNKIFEELRQLDRLSPEKANELRLEIGKFATAEDNGLSYKDKLINKFLSYKAGGRTFANTELMKELYDEIVRIKLIGKSAKSELDLLEKLDESKDIEELINIVQKKKDAKIFTKGYISGLGNLESTLNAIFNKDIKEKYGSEILYDETQAQAWQYKVKSDFEKEVAKIYGLPDWCWDKKVLDYLSEKHTYPEIRKKYDEKGEVIKVRNIDRTLTKMDIIQAYIWSKNEVLEKRLINQFGEDTLQTMFDELSLDDVKFAELMMRTAQSFYKLVNKAFIEKYGLDLPKVSCYFPSTPERGSEVDLYNEYSSKSLRNSFTKFRSQSEVQAMDFHNPVATLYSHIEGVAKFAFMSKNLDRANLRFKDLDLKRVIVNKYGEDAYRTLEQILINITYRKEAPVFNGVNKIIDNMVANWIGANVAIKPIVGLKQLLSANNYAVDMPYMTWQAGFLKALVNPKATIDYMMNIPYIKARYSGNMSNEFLKQTIENSAFAVSKKFKDSMSLFIKMGDIGAIIFGGKPYIDYLIKEKGMSSEQAIKQFILSTNRSQQSSAVSSLSNFQVAMTRNPMGKLFIAFKNSPQQYVRMCGDAIVSVANGDMSTQECAKMIFQYAYLQPFLYAAATSGSLFRFLFTRDDDDLLKDLKMSIFNLNANAIPLLGDIYLYAMNKLAYKEQVMPQITPLLGDIENEINKLSKNDIELKDYLEAIGYLGLHVGFGVNSKAIATIGSSIGDFAEGNVAKGLMKAIGYTDKRAKNITKK